jgi:nitrogen fixation NifU-like protein
MPDAYTEIVLDHFKNPRNVGMLQDPDALGRVENPASGASIVLYLQIVDEVVSQATFQTQGCTATIAASSMLTEMAVGRKVEEAEAISRVEIEEALGGLPPTRRHAAALAEDAVRAAVVDYRLRVQS